MYDALATGIFNCLVSPTRRLNCGGISVREDLVPELDKRIKALIETNARN